MNEYDSDTIEVCNKEVKVTYIYDEDTCAPWEDNDSDLVSQWTIRDKRPGERVLYQDRSSKRFYDWQAACKRAREDGWRSTTAPGIEGAVQAHFDYLRAWCVGDWGYVGVCVEYEGEEDSLWGVETWKDYHRECAREMATGIVARVEEEKQDVAYWHSRDVLTVKE